MEVNKNKTKIIVFRKGAFLAKHEKWFYNDSRLEVVNKYYWLGFSFTTKQGNDIRIKILYSKMQPILLYSSEICGLQRFENIEKFHLLACKRFRGCDHDNEPSAPGRRYRAMQLFKKWGGGGQDFFVHPCDPGELHRNTRKLIL